MLSERENSMIPLLYTLNDDDGEKKRRRRKLYVHKWPVIGATLSSQNCVYSINQIGMAMKEKKKKKII